MTWMPEGLGDAGRSGRPGGGVHGRSHTSTMLRLHAQPAEDRNVSAEVDGPMPTDPGDSNRQRVSTRFAQ